MHLLDRAVTWGSQDAENPPQNTFTRSIIILGVSLFIIAFAVRLLTWQDNRFEVKKLETYVTDEYRTGARQLASGDFKAYASNLNHLSHPPGYSILLALLIKVWGDSDSLIQFTQMIPDSAAAVIVFLLVYEMLPLGAAIIAGLLAALSPQFAYYSVVLLPDSLSVLPIILAVYFLVRASKRPRQLTIISAGVCVGISCWMRANALLLAPFLVAVIPILFRRGQRLRFSAALVAATLVVISPLTIRNYLLYRHFIPLSLGAGQKLLEGIAEYDKEGRFGIPKTDLGIVRQEAEVYSRPDYAQSLFGADGIARDRMRVARGLAVIRAHPAWYLGVMFRRAGTFFRLARVPIASRYPPVTHSLDATERSQPVWSRSPGALIDEGAVASTQARGTLSGDGQTLKLVGDDSKSGDQVATAPVAVRRNSDYVFSFPLQLQEGRMFVSVTDADTGDVLVSTVIDLVEGAPPQEQPLNLLKISFVSGTASRVQLKLSNGASTPIRPTANIGRTDLFELGPANYLGTRFPRFLVRTVQRFYLTAWVLPLAIIGLVLLAHRRQSRIIAVLLVVPVYYCCVESALHTERRYVFVIQYFLLMLAAAALFWIGAMFGTWSLGLWQKLRR
jgi:hypothetical protein